MKLIIIVYLLLQLAALLFLSFEFKQEIGWIVNQILISVSTCILYLTTHCKNPGYFTGETANLDTPNSTQPLPPPLPGYNVNSISEADISAQVQSQPQKRYCKFCKIDQLIRMKHCYQCSKCVATFDHHCVWLDCCIGEKNRPFFFVYIIVQTLQIADTMIAMIATMYQRGQKQTYQIVILSFLGIIGSAVLSLVVLHSYLMVSNLTTWQKTRWEKIHYLVDFEPRQGSPFNRGLHQNIFDYWSSGWQKGYRSWKFTIKPCKQQNQQAET